MRYSSARFLQDPRFPFTYPTQPRLRSFHYVVPHVAFSPPRFQPFIPLSGMLQFYAICMQVYPFTSSNTLDPNNLAHDAGRDIITPESIQGSR